MNLSPITLFVYNRLAHTKKTIEALRENYLARESELFIFSDASKNRDTEESVRAVRDYLKTIRGFKKVIICEREKNIGLSENITLGISDIIDRYGRVIVLEDDLLVSRYFLKYMNDALVFYEKEEKVISVCGHTYPIGIENQETFFLRIADCWDNAVAESFFHMLKVELIRRKTFRTREEAKQAIFEYIEIYYNRKLTHSTLGTRAILSKRNRKFSLNN